MVPLRGKRKKGKKEIDSTAFQKMTGLGRQRFNGGV